MHKVQRICAVSTRVNSYKTGHWLALRMFQGSSFAYLPPPPFSGPLYCRVLRHWRCA